jgi:hypothetical protein
MQPPASAQLRHLSLSEYQPAPRACRQHPELTEVLCVELMTRQLDAQSTTAIQQHAMLACLAPWMENLSFAARWEGAMLRCPETTYVCNAHCPASLPMEDLWLIIVEC